MLLTPRIGPTPVLLLQDGAVLCAVSESFAVVARHVTAGVPQHLHGNAAACDWLNVDRARKVVDVHNVYHAPNVVQPKVPLLVAGGSYPLVLGRKGLENDVLVPLVVYCLSHFLEEVTAFVQNENEVVRVLAGLYLRVEEFLVARPSVSSVWTLYFSVRAFHALRPCPAPSPGRFPSNFLTVLLAKPDVVKGRTLQRSWFARYHLCSATA